MRVLALALGAAAAVGFTPAVAAGQATDHIQLAQAQNTGAQQGAGTGATEQGSSGNRSGGAAATPSSGGGGRATVRTDTGSGAGTEDNEAAGACAADAPSDRLGRGSRTSQAPDRGPVR